MKNKIKLCQCFYIGKHPWSEAFPKHAPFGFVAFGKHYLGMMT
jgi:hypothetical protein